MPHDAIRQWKSTGKTCTFSEYLDLIAPAQEEYIRKCTDGLTASAAHWAVNHQETWPYGLRDFTLGVVSSWDLDDVMDSKSYEEMPQKYGGSFDQAVERARRLGAALSLSEETQNHILLGLEIYTQEIDEGCVLDDHIRICRSLAHRLKRGWNVSQVAPTEQSSKEPYSAPFSYPQQSM